MGSLNPGKNRERKCSTCKHYQPSPLWRKGWCRNPLLYDRNTNHLVESESLACNRTFIDYWEPAIGPSAAAGPQPRSPKPRIAPSIPIDTLDAAGKRSTVTGNTPAAGMAAVAARQAPRSSEQLERPALSLVKASDFEEFEADPHATLQIDEIDGRGGEARDRSAAQRIKKARQVQRKGLAALMENRLLFGLVLAVLLVALGGGVWLATRQGTKEIPKALPTTTVAAVIPSPTGFGDPTATAPPAPTEPPAAPTDRIAVGGYVQVNGNGSGLVVRSAATRQGARLGVIPDGRTAHVIEGPVDADGFTWWKVDQFNSNDPAASGWCAAQFLKPIPKP